ncbi:MAG TPA: hypothetical protein VLC50_05065 [Actinomycetes bacterium]|nr:hypothetical protein [Actinomycetes bacterium]
MSSAGISWAALAPLILLAVAWVAFCLVQIVRAPGVRGLPRWAWVLVVVLSVPLGGVVFLLAGRAER